MEKIKLFLASEKGKDVLTVIIVILVGLFSFQLGRLSKENNENQIKIEYPNQTASAIIGYEEKQTKEIKSVVSSAVQKNFFASNRGEKYYSVGCSAGKTIKEENRIYFNTEEEAERAGYTKSTNCK